MISELKEYLKQRRKNYLYRQYEQEYLLQKDEYYAWRVKNELKKYRKSEKLHSDYMFLTDDKIQISDFAIAAVNRKIKESGMPDIIYGDEDFLDSNGKRSAPFFKPCWSPDTFLSFNYLGRCVCVKKSMYCRVIKSKTLSPAAQMYDSLLQMVAMGARVEHVDQVLFHKRCDEKCEEDNEIELIKHDFIKRQNINADVEYEHRSRCYRMYYHVQGNPKISVIIPSKDHPDILRKCIDSLVSLTSYKNYELIVIDNGSTAENRKKIECMLEKYGALYHYVPMTFNYSRMCNLGVDFANGEYLLFLNDDIEILHSDWMERMLGHAQLVYTGAVGAKLLYPDKQKLQHVGVTMLEPGPAHKLISWPDNRDYYYHRNLLEYNYTAVTGACLLVKKDKFERAGRFDEKMPINYNDVELCIRLYKLGFYNVIRNDAVLCHHESLSRGNDRLRKETRIRLKQELNYLYKKHPDFCRKDPFYSINLTGKKPTFEPNANYPYEDMEAPSKCREYKGAEEKEITEAVRIKIDTILYTDTIVHVEGWSYVMHADNACYKRELILQDISGKTSSFRLSVFSKYRKDVSSQFKDEENIGLAGFVCHIPIEKLKENTKYKIGIMASARFSRQELYNEAEKMLDTTGEL